MVTSENRNITHKIRTRISKKYREKCINEVQRSRAHKRGEKLPTTPKKLQRTATITALINNFFNAVMLQGIDIIPSDLETDSENTDDEFFKKVVWKGVLRGGPDCPPGENNKAEISTPPTKSKNNDIPKKKKKTLQEKNQSSTDNEQGKSKNETTSKTKKPKRKKQKVAKTLTYSDSDNSENTDAKDSGDKWKPEKEKKGKKDRHYLQALK